MLPIGEGQLNFNAGMSFKSRTYQFEVAIPQIDQPAYQLFDASIVYRAPDGRWSLGVFGKNLTDERIRTSGYNFIAATSAITGVLTNPPVSALGREGVLTAFYANPRQFYVTGTIKF